MYNLLSLNFFNIIDVHLKLWSEKSLSYDENVTFLMNFTHSHRNVEVSTKLTKCICLIFLSNLVLIIDMHSITEFKTSLLFYFTKRTVIVINDNCIAL